MQSASKIKIGKGVKQGDIVSAKLFTSDFESIFWEKEWGKR